MIGKFEATQRHFACQWNGALDLSVSYHWSFGGSMDFAAQQGMTEEQALQISLQNSLQFQANWTAPPAAPASSNEAELERQRAVVGQLEQAVDSHRRHPTDLPQADAPEEIFYAISKGNVSMTAAWLAEDELRVHARINLGHGPYSVGYGLLRYGKTALLKHWCTPLHLAVYEKQLGTVELLMQHRAQPLAVDGWDYSVVLSLASTNAKGGDRTDKMRAIVGAALNWQHRADQAKQALSDAKLQLQRIKMSEAIQTELQRRGEVELRRAAAASTENNRAHSSSVPVAAEPLTPTRESMMPELQSVGFCEDLARAALTAMGPGCTVDLAVNKALEIQELNAEQPTTGGWLDEMPAVPSADKPSAADESEEAECLACYDSVPIGDLVTVGCEERHVFCEDCICGYVRQTVQQEKKIATCPLCPHEIQHSEIRQLFPGDDEIYQAQLEIRLLNLMAQEGGGFVACPAPGCEQYLQLDLTASVQRVECPGCFCVFCSGCKQLHHPRLECGTVGPATERWYHWLREGRSEYKQEEKKEAFDQQVQEAMQRFEQLQQDEAWKEANCRLCPRCDRAVFKVDGCDSMTCGRDASDKGGGNQQDGCGKTFNWSNARPYTRGANSARLPKDMDSVEMESANQQKHHIVSTQSKLLQRADTSTYRIRCSACNEDIVGPLFSCINCDSWSCCQECEPLLTEVHDPAHVFTIHFEDFGDEMSADAPLDDVPVDEFNSWQPDPPIVEFNSGQPEPPIVPDDSNWQQVIDWQEELPSPALGALQTTGFWSCSACTMRNCAAAEVCTMCGTAPDARPL